MKKHIFLLSLIVLISSCTDQMFSKTKEIVKTPSITPQPTTSPLEFSGVKNVTNITDTSAEIHWEEVTGAATYTIFLATPNSAPIVKAVVKAPASSVVIKGLIPNSHYEVFVRLMDSHSLIDAQTNHLEFTTKEEPEFNNTTSLRFSGNESIKLKNSFEMFSHPQKFSISFWFKSNLSQKEEVRLVSLHRSEGPSENFSIGIDADKLFITYIDSSGDTKKKKLTTKVTDGVWHHIVLTSDVDQLNFYLDGKVALRELNTILSSFGKHRAFLGAMSGYQKGFEGQMDEVSFWNSPLSATDIAQLYSGKGQNNLKKLQAELALWLRMGDDTNDSHTFLIDQVSGAQMAAYGIIDADFLNDTP